MDGVTRRRRRGSMSNCWRAMSITGTLCLIAAATWARPVRIESGAIEGTTENGLAIYMGVPFAAPPLGELRWREPQPVAPWKGTRKATSFAPACMQKGVSMPGEKPPAVSEDCGSGRLALVRGGSRTGPTDGRVLDEFREGRRSERRRPAALAGLRRRRQDPASGQFCRC